MPYYRHGGKVFDLYFPYLSDFLGFLEDIAFLAFSKMDSLAAALAAASR